LSIDDENRGDFGGYSETFVLLLARLGALSRHHYHLPTLLLAMAAQQAHHI
jgi:hypothetical protein